MRLFYLCNESFRLRSGVFTVEQLSDVLAVNGYKTLQRNQGGNRQRKMKDLEKLLGAAPELFIQRKKGFYRVRSKHKIIRIRKNSLRKIDASILHKDNKREWNDLIIGIPANNKSIDLRTLAQITGYTSARVCQAAKANSQRRHILKVKNEIIISEHDAQFKAIRESKLLYKQYSIVSRVIQKRGRFLLVVSGANSYTSVMLNTKSQQVQPILTVKHVSPVFEVIKSEGLTNYCLFKPGQQENYFFRRYA